LKRNEKYGGQTQNTEAGKIRKWNGAKRKICEARRR
jgi:hypothetical protein